MRKYTVFCLLIATSYLNSFAVSGHAVSACWRYCVENWAGCVPEVLGTNDYRWRGKVIRVDIDNNTPSHCDTIYGGLAIYPTLSFDGEQVAFYRYDCTVDGDNLVGDCTTGQISVVNKDGTNLRDLAAWSGGLMHGFPDNECAMDWPAGGWIYYIKPPLTTSEIWRVDMNTPGSSEYVGSYTGNPSGDAFYIRRWSLSADGQYAGGQFKDGTCGQNIIHSFTPPIGDPCNTIPTDGTFPGCNGALSAGGHFFGSYIGGCHNTIVISEWNHETNTASWSIKQVANDDIADAYGQDMAVCSEMIRWSANSDKWVLQGTGWKAHAEDMRYGGNQLLVNWVDEVGFPVTDNPELPLTPEGWGVEGQTYYQNDPGDFFVSGGSAGCYEDRDGNWISVTTSAPGGMHDRGSLEERALGIKMRSDAIVISSLHGAELSINDSRGREILSGRTSGLFVIPKSQLPRGTYLARVVSETGAMVTRFLVSR